MLITENKGNKTHSTKNGCFYNNLFHRLFFSQYHYLMQKEGWEQCPTVLLCNISKGGKMVKRAISV